VLAEYSTVYKYVVVLGLCKTSDC